MKLNNKPGKELKEQAKAHHSLACQVCGKTVKTDEYSWQEDDNGIICCLNCRAEQESCGCSD